jgi:hypothetical protein
VKTRLSLIVAVSIMLALLAMPIIASAQAGQRRTGVEGWYKYGVAIPDLNGPAPRLPNGKPSLEGMWAQTRRADVTNPNVQPGHVTDLPFTPWGQRQWDNYDPVKDGDYAGSCLPFGWSRTVFGPHPMYLVHSDDKLVILSEQNSWFHIVYTDGRPHDPSLPPTWWGDSVGRWDGDTLIVETKNINGYAKIDTIGHPLSSQATITQTFRRVNFGTIEHTFTVNDPKTYTRPWTVRNTWPLEPFDTKMLEYSCEEGNLDALVEGAITPWHPPTGEDAP